MQSNLFPTFSKLVIKPTWSVPEHFGAAWKNSTLLFGDKLSLSQYHTLLLIESAYRGDVNATELFTAYSQEYRGYYRRTLNTFANRLKTGVPLIDALEQTPDVLPPSSVVAIRHGLATGSLSQTFQVLTKESIVRREAANTDGGFIRNYWLVVCLVLLVGMTFISAGILPSLLKMLQEFGMGPTAIMASYSSFTNFLIPSLPWILLAIVLLSITGLMAQLRAYLRRNLLPLVTPTKDLLSTATILRLISLQVHHPDSLRTSLTILAKYHNRKSIRLKLLLARNECELGMNFWQSLLAANLLTPAESKLLQSEPEPASQAWILNKLADLRDHRADVISDRFVVFMTPVLTLLWGGTVLWTALVVFHFIYALVNSLS